MITHNMGDNHPRQGRSGRLHSVDPDPYRAGDLVLADRYESLLSRGRGLTLIGINRMVLRTTAQLRARYRIRTPDAIQVPTAMVGGCQKLLTNDRELGPVEGLTILQLKDLRT